MSNILIIDDELKLLKLLGMILRQENFNVHEASSAKSGLIMLSQHPVDVVLCDVRLQDAFGIDLVKQIKNLYPQVEIILMTAYGNIMDAIQAMKNGAFDYLVKGDDNDRIIPLIHKALEKNKNNLKKIQKTESNENIVIIGNSTEIELSKKMAYKVAQTDATVLLNGETGTGKEVFAKYIHQESQRKNKNFVAINCASFSKDLLESELFGYKKGAFTGALQDKKGLVELAENGSLFLDEIGEMPIELQVKLLRLLESGEYIKLGDPKISKTNFRLIAATNKNLEEACSQGNFRSDLYFRLNVFKIHLPPLRERGKDLELLAQHFITKLANNFGKNKLQISKSFFKKIHHYHWPGNIRELKNTIERCLVLNENDILDENDLTYETNESVNSLKMVNIEKQHIEKVLHYCLGNKTETAQLLGIGLATLYRKIEEYGLK